MPIGNAAGRFYKDSEGDFYGIRNGLLDEVWMLVIKMNGFTSYMYVKGTEEEMRDYMDSEIPVDYQYHALSKEEVKMVKRLDQKIFIAPQH